ncbi:sensor histidine kinase [Methylibium rhizosphaerae]|uniref:sensor histidine kinase n=1 Tax=Methylibium rhizosphaerae TaxID=2570323 RepID=UPI00112875A1|nr:ATP-binding protein [Methylibium rhizosphaerae]
MQYPPDLCTDHRPTVGNEELLARLKRAESFNRSVSHDLRGPLAGLCGLAQLTSIALRKGDTESAAELVAGTSRQLSMLVEMVDGLLSLASANEAPLALSETDLEGCATQALELVRLGLAHKLPGARMPAVHIDRLPRSTADARLMRQVFANLLCNAAKFTQPVAQPRIEVGFIPGDHASTSVQYVRDNGIGFDPKHAAKLFEPFRRLHGAGFHGSGLGLSIVRSIVERHGGRVWIESEPGVGTTVFFTIAAFPGTVRPLAYNRA